MPLLESMLANIFDMFENMIAYKALEHAGRRSLLLTPSSQKFPGAVKPCLYFCWKACWQTFLLESMSNMLESMLSDMFGSMLESMSDIVGNVSSIL